MKGVSSLPGGMVQLKARVLLHREIAAGHYQMRLKAPGIATRATPGQFVHVRCGDEKATFPLLRRPLSLLDVDPKTGTIDFVYKVVGLGTQALTQILKGDRIDTLGPLGRPFEVPKGLSTAYLVGGGVGIPPLVLLAKRLVQQKCRVIAFLGARTKEWVICIPQFHRLGVQVQSATDDGTLGYRGSVVDLLRKSLRASQGHHEGVCLYICGPTPMMAAAAKVAQHCRLSAQVSLEERMGCAMGCCLGCVVEIATEPATSHSRFQRVCTEGPVFPAEEILW